MPPLTLTKLRLKAEQGDADVRIADSTRTAAYRQLFGELPSITAAKRRRSAVAFSRPNPVTSP